MLESFTITHLIFAMIQFLMGVLANGIIVVVNSADLIKQRKMLPFDLLLCCLATSRICLQIIIIYSNLVVLSLVEYSPFAQHFTFFMFAHKLELWLATWLSVFYCTKISTITHPLFFWLKLRISKLVPWLILGTLLYTSLMSVLCRKYVRILSQRAWLNLLFQNATIQTQEIPTSEFAFFLLEQFCPLLIFLTSVLLLLFSLGRHTRQIMSTAVGTRHPGTRVHISALLSFLSFLVLYVSQYMMAALMGFQMFKLKSHNFLLCALVIGLYPSVHSVILILGNSKLKQNAKKFLFHSKCCP